MSAPETRYRVTRSDGQPVAEFAFLTLAECYRILYAPTATVDPVADHAPPKEMTP